MSYTSFLIKPEAAANVVNQLCGEVGSPKREAFEEAAGQYAAYMNILTISVKYDASTYDTQVCLTADNGLKLVQFYLKPVESCCGMTFLYGFIAHACITQEILDGLLKAVLSAGRHVLGLFSSQRLIVNMVERRVDNKVRNALAVITPIENPNIEYKVFWTSFQNNAARVNTMLMPNKNTGNIIHHMEVLYPAEYFEEG